MWQQAVALTVVRSAPFAHITQELGEKMHKNLSEILIDIVYNKVILYSV